MKRDINLMRQILLKVEEAKHIIYVRDLADPAGDNLSIVAQHVEWLEEGSLLKVDYLLENAPERAADGIILRQTWKACEFLDLARDEQTWGKVNSMISERFETTSFDVIHSLLTEIARASLLSREHSASHAALRA